MKINAINNLNFNGYIEKEIMIRQPGGINLESATCISKLASYAPNDDIFVQNVTGRKDDAHSIVALVCLEMLNGHKVKLIYDEYLETKLLNAIVKCMRADSSEECEAILGKYEKTR